MVGGYGKTGGGRVSQLNIRTTHNEAQIFWGLMKQPLFCFAPRPNWPFVKLPYCGLLTLVFITIVIGRAF